MIIFHEFCFRNLLFLVVFAVLLIMGAMIKDDVIDVKQRIVLIDVYLVLLCSSKVGFFPPAVVSIFGSPCFVIDAVQAFLNRNRIHLNASFVSAHKHFDFFTCIIRRLFRCGCCCCCCLLCVYDDTLDAYLLR